MSPWNFQKSSPKIQYNSGHFKAPTQHVSSQGRQPPDDSSAYIEVHGIVLNLQHVHVVNVDYAFFLYLEGLLKNHIRQKCKGVGPLSLMCGKQNAHKDVPRSQKAKHLGHGLTTTGLRTATGCLKKVKRPSIISFC